MPAPDVDSSVVEFLMHSKYSVDKEPFNDFVSRLFNMKRKTILNNLMKVVDKEKAKTLLSSCNIKENVRPEELVIDDFINLFTAMNDLKSKTL